MTLKRNYILLTVLFASLGVSAQGILDLMRYSDRDILGTARYMGMAGSFGALGGDASAILDNPGALGVYRTSELSFSLNPTITNTISKSTNLSTKENEFFFNFSNASLVVAIPTYKTSGLMSVNLSFTYNRVKDFSRITGYRNTSGAPSIAASMARFTQGFAQSAIFPENENLPYLSDLAYNAYIIDPMADSVSWKPIADRSVASAYYGIESGRVEEYNFAYGMNFSHKVYVGISLGVQNIDYSMQSENTEKYNDSQYLKLKNDFRTSGVGLNFGAGFIVRATSFLRLGASIHTPTYYVVDDYFSGSMSATNVVSGVNPDALAKTPASGIGYEFSTPLRFMASAGFIIGKKALINVEYQLSDYKSTMRFDDDYSGGDYLNGLFGYEMENAEIDKYSRISHLIKVGGEYRVASQFSFRAGVAYATPAVSENVVRTMLDNTTRTDLDYFFDKGSIYGSIGFGYRYNGFGIDIAYLYRNRTEGFATHQLDAELNLEERRYGVPTSAPEVDRSMADVVTHKHNIALTLLYKF